MYNREKIVENRIMKSKFFGMILGLALSMQSMIGMQNPDMEAWLKNEFDRCSNNADVRVRQVFDKGLAIDVGNKQYIIDAKGNIYHRVWGTDSLDDNSLCKVAVRTNKDAYEEWTGRTAPNCPDIKCSRSASGVLLSISILDGINFSYNVLTGELVLNNTDYDKKLVIEANRICTARTVNVKDLILKSYEDWFLNFASMNTTHFRVFSHFGVNYGSYNSKNTTEWTSVQLNLLLENSEKIYNKYVGMNGFYSAPGSDCNVQNITTKDIMEVQFGGTTHIGGTLNTDAQVILGYRDGTPDPDSLVYQCHINEIKNAPNILVDTSSKITNIANGGIHWDRGKVKKITPKTEGTVKKLKDVFVTNPPVAIKNVNRDDLTDRDKWFLRVDGDFLNFMIEHLKLSMLNTALKKLIESDDPQDRDLAKLVYFILQSVLENTPSNVFERQYDVKLCNNGQLIDLKLEVKGTNTGYMITFYSSDGREYKGEEDVNLAIALNNACLNLYWQNENLWRQQWVPKLIEAAATTDEFFSNSEENQPMSPQEDQDDSDNDSSNEENGQGNDGRQSTYARLAEVIGAPSFEGEQVESYIRYPEFALHFFMSDANKMAEQRSENQDASLVSDDSDLYPKDKCSIF